MMILTAANKAVKMNEDLLVSCEFSLSELCLTHVDCELVSQHVKSEQRGCGAWQQNADTRLIRVPCSQKLCCAPALPVQNNLLAHPSLYS